MFLLSSVFSPAFLPSFLPSRITFECPLYVKPHATGFTYVILLVPSKLLERSGMAPPNEETELRDSRSLAQDHTVSLLAEPRFEPVFN